MEYQLPGKVFNYLILRTIIGVIALLLPFVVWFVANLVYSDVDIPTSISVTYHLGARDIFVGSLFVVSAFLFSYNGFHSDKYPNSQVSQSRLSKLAGACAAIVALFPTTCKEQWISEVTEIGTGLCKSKPYLDFLPVGAIHTGAAVVLFIILAIFCLHYFQIGTKGEGGKKERRSRVYRLCGWTMVGAMIVGAINFVAEWLGWYGGSVSKVMFFVELVCLIAFGIAWLVVGKQLSYFASDEERKGLE